MKCSSVIYSAPAVRLQNLMAADESIAVLTLGRQRSIYGGASQVRLESLISQLTQAQVETETWRILLCLRHRRCHMVGNFQVSASKLELAQIVCHLLTILLNTSIPANDGLRVLHLRNLCLHKR